MNIIDKIKNFKNIKKTKFKDLSYEWLENKKKKVKKSTYLIYKYMVEKYINPELGDIRIKELEEYDFTDYIGNLSEKLAPKTIKDILTVLKSILYYIEGKYNIKIKVDEIVNPKQNKNPMKILSKDEQKKLEKICLEENNLKSLGIIICLNTGLRIGEICALKWENIDLDRKEIKVRKTLERMYDYNEKTKIIIDTPKSESSVRDIPISNKIYELLINIKNKYTNDCYFLSGKKDKFVEPGNYRAYFKRILKKCKIKNNYKFHILRHTFATNCLEVGMDVKALSEILGHSSVEITLNKYIHSSTETKRKYLEKL